MANQIYFNGDFWQCVADAAEGESPETNPEKWRRIRIPAEWRRVLAKLTYAGLLELDGQTDKAKLHRDAGEAMLDDLVREAANQDKDGHRGNVHTPQGQTVKASVILNDAYRAIRWDTDDLEDSEKADAYDSLSQALQQVWDAWWWESLMKIETLALRPNYSASEECAAGVERYFPPTGKYYLTVQQTANTPPATLVNGAYVLNGGFWAESQRCYSANEVDNTTAYDWGTQVKNPADGLFYQRAASYQTSGGGDDAFNQIWTISGLGGGYPQWGAVNSYTIIGYPGNWVFQSADTNQGYSENDGGTALYPDLVTSWLEFGLNFETPPAQPSPTFSRSFVAPSPNDANHWGLLIPFDPILTIATKVRMVSHMHPRLTHNPRPYRFEPVDGGVRVPDWTCGLAWVWSRRVTPILDGADYDGETTYEATPTNELVYDE